LSRSWSRSPTNASNSPQDAQNELVALTQLQEDIVAVTDRLLAAQERLSNSLSTPLVGGNRPSESASRRSSDIVNRSRESKTPTDADSQHGSHPTTQ
jgi:hypothetical protein